MKLVVAVVRPEKLSDVLEALFRAQVQGLTISRVQGHGGEMERVETYRGTTVKMELSDKVRVEIGVSDHFVEPTVRAILAGGRTGTVGDGKIFVLPVEKVYRIRTAEEDRAAVTPVGIPPGYVLSKRPGGCAASTPQLNEHPGASGASRSPAGSGRRWRGASPPRRHGR